MELADYKITVAQLLADYRATGTPRSFENYGVDHARVVLGAMIGTAETSIRIYSQKLNARAYDAKWFDAFLARTGSTELTLLIEDANVFTDPESVLNGKPAFVRDPRVTIHLVPAESRSQHIALVDGKLARVETSQDHYKASVAFGEQPLTKESNDAFNAVLGRSARLPVG